MCPRRAGGTAAQPGWHPHCPSPQPTLLATGSVVSDLYAPTHLILAATLCKKEILQYDSVSEEETEA